jgi:preprotein translocase subunit YajC
MDVTIYARHFLLTYKTKRTEMKKSTFKDLLMLGALASVAYYIARYYRQKKQESRELRESIHFQLF